MSRYKHLFERCESENRIAFIPFLMLGDPDFETSLSIIETLVESGVDALELGIAFSDPVADGPVIQAAAIRALEQKMTPDRAFELLTRVREKFPEIAIGLLLYANLVYRKGIEQFYLHCNKLNIDSVLIADVPIRESQIFDQYAQQYHVDAVHILPPHASENTIMQVAKKSRGYTYVLGRSGVTGTHDSAQIAGNEVTQQLKAYQAAPAVMGFGISQPEQVAEAKRCGFAGTISGSAVVKIISSYLDRPDEMLSQLASFVKSMKAAT